MRVKSAIKKVLLKIMAWQIFPVKKNKVIFDNFNGKGFGCNPKYIAQGLINSR